LRKAKEMGSNVDGDVGREEGIREGGE